MKQKNAFFANCQLSIAHCSLSIACYFLLIANCLLPIASFAQNTFRYAVCPDVGPLPRWNIGGDVALHQVSSDSGYISFSHAELDAVRPNDTAGYNCFGATKLDKYGNLEWIKAYQQKSGLTGKTVNDGIPTADSGFIMAGFISGNVINTLVKNTLIQKMDKDGHLTWAKVYTVGSNVNEALKILQMPNGDYIVLGQTEDAVYSSRFHDGFNTYLLRLDKDGKKLWCNYYDAGKNGNEYPKSLELTDDGAFIIGGYTNTINESSGYMIGFKALMMKVSGNGQMQWARRYGEVFNGTFPISGDIFNEVKQTKDGDYIAVGQTEPDGHDTKGWVVKTDAQGIIIWQKVYDTWSNISKVEILSDGYMLASNEYESGNLSGSGFGRLTKINTTGDVEWSKLYDSQIVDINLTMNKGFVVNFTGSIAKTNSLGEFDKGCIYNGASLSSVIERVDTLYTLTPTVVNLTPSDLLLKEVSITRHTCPVICNISNKPTPPSYIYAGSIACVNTDAPVYTNPYGADSPGNFSHIKVDFGDPASGVKNNASSSSSSEYQILYHNYSNIGTYTITMIVYNGDYSLSDTISTKVVVVPQLKYTLVTPEINICNRADTGKIVILLDNYIQDAYYVAIREKNINQTNNTTILSVNQTINDSLGTIVASILPDTLNSFYAIDIHDAYTGGCRIQDTVRIITGRNKAAITGNAEICKGGTASLKAYGGDSYLWSTGATTGAITVSPASNKTYWVEATSTHGCRDTAYFYVKVVPAIHLEAFADRKHVCTGDIVKMYATGASTYSWNNGGTGDTTKVVANAGSNTFIVTGTSGSCTSTASIVITADDKPVGIISGPAKACYNDEITVTASGGDSYYWYMASDRTSPVQVLRVNNVEYNNVVIVSRGACSDTVIYSISAPYHPSIAGIEASECRVCPGTQVTLRKYFYPLPSYYLDRNEANNPENQGLTYLWSTGQTGFDANDSIKINISRDTIITLTTTNSYGCSTTNSVAIEASPHFYIKKEVSPLASCGNTPTTLYLMGEPQLDLDYTWLHNGSHADTLVVSPLQDTMYYVSVTANGCTRKDSVWVEAKSNLPKARITGDSIVCKGGKGTYAVKGDITAQSYKWLTGNNADTQFSLTTPIAANTTLKAVVIFSGACRDTAEYKISIVDVPHASISGDTVVCPGGTTSLKASGGSYYRWSTGEISPGINVKALTDTLVRLYAFAGNCKDSASVIIKTNQTINATLFSDEDTTCTGTPLTLIAEGGDHYSWSTGGKDAMLGIFPAVTTTYTVTVTTKDNCKDSKSITIHVSPAPIAQITSASVCQGDILTLTASGGDKYLWNTGNVNASLTIKNPKMDSVYRVIVSVGSCSDDTQAKVSILPKPLVDAGADLSINYGNSVPIFATGSGTYQWSPATGISCTDCASPLAEPATSTLYYITLKDANGCVNTDSILVFVDLPCGDVFIPSAFSPNKDGNNDVLFVRGRCIQSLSFSVYDRWGEKVFEAVNPTMGWDGTYNEKSMNSGMFVYSLEATLTNGEVMSRKGNVVLMK